MTRTALVLRVASKREAGAGAQAALPGHIARFQAVVAESCRRLLRRTNPQQANLQSGHRPRLTRRYYKRPELRHLWNCVTHAVHVFIGEFSVVGFHNEHVQSGIKMTHQCPSFEITKWILLAAGGGHNCTRVYLRQLYGNCDINALLLPQ